MSDSLHIEIANDPAELEGAAAQIRTFLKGAGLSRRELFVADLAVEEMATNIIRHGFEDDAPRRIKLGVELGNGEVVLSFDDDGQPFDPTTAPEPPIPPSIEHARIGGLGIQMVRRMSARMAYQRLGDRNHLRVHVPLHRGR